MLDQRKCQAMPRKGHEDHPLTRQEMAFATWFCRSRDIYRAAEKAKVAKNQAIKLFNRIEIQEEIERQQDVHRQEQARQLVTAENLNNELLDRELVRVIRKESGSVAIEAIRLGYIATGRIQAGTTRVIEPLEAVTAGQPNFYQAFVPVGMPVGMPIDAAPAPILPDLTPETVAQGGANPPPPPRGPFKPAPSAPSAPAEPSEPSEPRTPAPTGTPPRKAGKLQVG